MAAPVTNIVGISYVDIATHRMANIQSTMDHVLNAQVAVLHPILKALFVLFVARQFYLVMRGDLKIEALWDAAIRGLIVVFLVIHTQNFVQYVRDPVFNKIPQAMSSFVGGQYAGTGATQPLATQFDQMSAKGDAIANEIDSVDISFFDVNGWTNRANGHIANLQFQTMLGLIVAIWLLGQTLLAIILCLGPPLLCFELWPRTRGWVDAWLGKLVGSAAFGFATSFVLAMEMNEMQHMFDQVRGAAAGNAAAAAGVFGHIATNSVIDLITIAVLPTAIGFGSGAVAALSAPSMMIAMRALSISSGSAAAIGRSAGRALARTK